GYHGRPPTHESRQDPRTPETTPLRTALRAALRTHLRAALRTHLRAALRTHLWAALRTELPPERRDRPAAVGAAARVRARRCARHPRGVLEAEVGPGSL